MKATRPSGKCTCRNPRSPRSKASTSVCRGTISTTADVESGRSYAFVAEKVLIATSARATQETAITKTIDVGRIHFPFPFIEACSNFEHLSPDHHRPACAKKNRG